MPTQKRVKLSAKSKAMTACRSSLLRFLRMIAVAKPILETTRKTTGHNGNLTSRDVKDGRG